jgi:hypothetical protein
MKPSRLQPHKVKILQGNERVGGSREAHTIIYIYRYIHTHTYIHTYIYTMISDQNRSKNLEGPNKRKRSKRTIIPHLGRLKRRDNPTWDGYTARNHCPDATGTAKPLEITAQTPPGTATPLETTAQTPLGTAIPLEITAQTPLGRLSRSKLLLRPHLGRPHRSKLLLRPHLGRLYRSKSLPRRHWDG